MFNKVPEEKVFDYILTMLSMLDGRWLACERVSSFYHLLLFCLYLIVIAFLLYILFCAVILCWRLQLFVVCIKAPATSQRCSVFFSFIYRLYVQVFLGMKIKLKWAGVYYGKRIFGKVKKLLVSNTPNPKVFSKPKNDKQSKSFLNLKGEQIFLLLVFSLQLAL